ncbi:MAG: hypothetical protein AAGB11_01560 [Pseudomonadota bacterium]
MSEDNNAIVTIECDLIAKTERAVRVRDHYSGKIVVLPLSQIEHGPAVDGVHHEVQLPDWLAIERELI